MSPIGLGNDIGGSLRNPATACGIASIRPSAGRVPDAGYVPVEDRLMAVQLMNVQGPMARRVADVRLGLRVLMGAHPRDPWSIDAPFDGPKLGRPIRVAVLAEPPGGSTHPQVAATVRRAAQALADAGYVVEEVAPPRYEDAISCWARLIMGDFNSVLAQLQPMMGADAIAFLNAANGAVPPLADATAWSHLMVERDGVARAWSTFMADRPLLLSPTWTQLPFEHGFDFGDARGDRGDHGADASGGPRQPAGIAVGVRSRRPRRGDGVADRCAGDWPPVSGGFVPGGGRGDRGPPWSGDAD